MAEHEIKDTDEEGNPICGRKLNYRDGYCENPPGFQTDHEGEGACFSCGGTEADSGAPEGNLNSMTHGRNVPPSRYFEHLDANQQRFVVDIYRSYITDAPFGYDNFAKSSDVWLAAIDRHKKLRINGLLSDQGMQISEDKVAPDGSLYSEKKEHPLMLAYHRLERDNMAKLQKLGILEEDSSTKMENGEMSVEVQIHGVDEDGNETETDEITSE